MLLTDIYYLTIKRTLLVVTNLGIVFSCCSCGGYKLLSDVKSEVPEDCYVMRVGTAGHFLPLGIGASDADLTPHYEIWEYC